MARARSCACNWEYVGESLGSVWFRGNRQTFVAVRPDGSLLGADFRTRGRAMLALVMDARRREGVAGALFPSTDPGETVAEVIDLSERRRDGEGAGKGLLRLLNLRSN